MITLSHPTELGNKCAWNLIDGLEHVDPSMTILAPNQCYDAYTKALPKLQASVNYTASTMQSATLPHLENPVCAIGLYTYAEVLRQITCGLRWSMALQDLLESPSVDTSHTKKKDKKGEWGPTLVKIAGVTAMSLWNPAYAAGYLVLNTVVDQYLN